VKPLMYGYMRLHGDEPDNDIRQMELVLKDCAEAEGYCFATIFHEYDSGSHAAFDELVEKLKRAEAHHVIVPTLDHLSRHPLLRINMLTRLQFEAQAQVLALGDSQWKTWTS